MDQLSLLLTSVLFGGMCLFSFGFAMLMFKIFEPKEARRAIRESFPPYYLFVIASSALAALFAALVSIGAGLILAAISLSTVYARQVLMPKINAATDTDNKPAFKRLHGASVILQLIQIALAGWALIQPG
ncbi:MAG: DUF4149 domain-containing protein [Pseudomonadota bacterium]